MAEPGVLEATPHSTWPSRGRIKWQMKGQASGGQASGRQAHIVPGLRVDLLPGGQSRLVQVQGSSVAGRASRNLRLAVCALPGLLQLLRGTCNVAQKQACTPGTAAVDTLRNRAGGKPGWPCTNDAGFFSNGLSLYVISILFMWAPPGLQELR